MVVFNLGEDHKCRVVSLVWVEFNLGEYHEEPNTHAQFEAQKMKVRK